MKNTMLMLALAGLAWGTPSSVFADQVADTSSSWSSRWEKFENEMDGLFHDAVTKLSPGQKETTFSSSVDVRETPEAYVARIYLPQSDQAKLSVVYENGMLRVSSGEAASGGYKEDIGIPSPVQPDKMKVERKGGIVVVTLPKAAGNVAQQASPAPVLAPWGDAADQNILREMERMQDAMDQMTRDLTPMTNQVAAMQQLLGSKVNMEEQKDKYVVHFYLPDRDISNVSAKVDQNRLTLTASEQSKKENKQGTNSTAEFSQGEYSQIITLPGAVRADQMKVERKEGTVTVTLPKS